MAKNIPLLVGMTVIAFLFWGAVLFTVENPPPRTEPVRWYFPAGVLALMGGLFTCGILAGRRMR